MEYVIPVIFIIGFAAFIWDRKDKKKGGSGISGLINKGGGKKNKK